MACYFIMIRVYLYLQKTLKLKDRFGKMRLELEKNLRSIERMVLAPVRISIQETYQVN